MRLAFLALAYAAFFLLPTAASAQDDSPAQDDSAFPVDSNLDAAIAEDSQTINSDPGNDNAYLRRGRLYFAKAAYEFAIRDFTHVLQDDATNAPALFQRARSYFRNNDLDDAIADYNQFILMRPQAAPAYINRGVAYIRKGDNDRAIDDETHALQIKPDNVLALTNRAWAYRLKGHYDDAIADLTQSLQLEPNRVSTFVSRGVAYGLKGDYTDARADFTMAIQLNPDAAFAYDDLAWQMATCPDAGFRDGKTAITNATKACQIENWLYPGAVATLAAAYAEAGDFDQAIQWQTKFLTYDLSEEVATRGLDHLKLYQNHQPYHREDLVRLNNLPGE